MPTDLVAGRTSQQIEAAKRKAVGGKRKRCVKGKSCSATCIASNRVCMVDIPWVAAEGIGPMRDKLAKKMSTMRVPSELPVRLSDRPSLVKEKDDFNTLLKNINLQIKAGNLSPEGKEYLVDLAAARKKALQAEKEPAALKEKAKRHAEGPLFLNLNRRLNAAERLANIYDELVPVLIKKRDKETPGTKEHARRADQLREARKLRRLAWFEAEKIEKEKKELKDKLKAPSKPKPTSGPGPATEKSNYGKIAISKVSGVILQIKKLPQVLKVKGSELADNINWDAIAQSGARRVGRPGAYGAFISVPVENLFKLGVRGSYPNGVGVKGGKIGVNEAQIIKKVGQADLGPKLIAAKMSPNFANTAKTVYQAGLIAMSKIVGKDFESFSSPQDRVNGVEISSAFWKARRDLHKLGVAHNDMHVGNVLIDSKGKARFVDFGLAQNNPRAALAEAIGAASGSDWQVRRWEQLGTNYAKDYGYATAPEFDKISRNWDKLKVQMQSDGLTASDIAAIANGGIRQSNQALNSGVWKNPVLTDSKVSSYIDILYEGV